MTTDETKRSQLIKQLVELQSALEDRTVTRKIFRNETGVKDSEWEKFFGSFNEFLAAAGINKTKIQKKIISSIVRHTGVEKLKQITLEKGSFEGKYLKPFNSRFQTILSGSDIHDRLCDPFYRMLFIETAKRVQPEKVVLAGDIFDMYEFSRYQKDPRKTNILESIQWVHEFLEDIRKAAPNTEIVMTSGNHEERMLRYLGESSSQLIPILSELHGFTVSSLLGLDKYEVNYISKSNLAVFTETDLKKEIAKNYYIAYDTVLFHHFPYAKNWGYAGLNGHHHQHICETHFSPSKGPYEWHQLGSGHVRNAEYCEGEKWGNGFMLIHVDTLKKFAQFEYIDCSGEFAVVGGQWYQRPEGTIVQL